MKPALYRPQSLSQNSETPRQAETDEQVIDLWLFGRTPQTHKAYATDITQFFAFVRKPLGRVTLQDIQDWAQSMSQWKPRTQMRKLAAIKSLFRFACQIGYLRFDPASAVRLPKIPSDKSERYLSEEQVRMLLAAAASDRDLALFTLLYATGARISELCNLRWKGVTARESGGGHVHVLGKGKQSRSVLVSPKTFALIWGLSADHPKDVLVFGITANHARRRLKKTAKLAHLPDETSPHWLRHAHISHALDRGAPIHLVQSTVGHRSMATTGEYAHARPQDSSALYLSI